MTIPSRRRLTNGDAGRYIKPSYVKESSVSPNAFDLRLNRNVPEPYVSFFLSRGPSDEEKFWDVFEKSKAGLTPKKNGFICLISIEEALNAINIGNELIWFTDERIPHLGLRYSTDASNQEILEAKSLLSWFANQRLQLITNIAKYLPMNK